MKAQINLQALMSMANPRYNRCGRPCRGLRHLQSKQINSFSPCPSISISDHGANMEKSVSHVNRREFLTGSAAFAAVGATLPMQSGTHPLASPEAAAEFDIYQQRRRWELWSLLGELPWDHKPAPPRLARSEKHDGYTLERWILDLNGIEPVPAVLLIPDRRQERA